MDQPWFHDNVADSSSGSGSADFETSGVDTYTRIDQKREPQGLFFEGNSGYFEIPFAAPMGDEVHVLVDIDIEGPLAEFMEKTGDLNLVRQSFILESGDGDKLLAGMLKAIDISGLDKDVLYGSVINIRESRYSHSGDPDPEYDSESHSKNHTVKTSYELYRWLDVVGAKEDLGAGVTVGLHEKEENELGEFTKMKEFDYFLPESKGITLAGTNENIDYTQTASGIAGTGTAKWEVSELPIAFTPEEGGDFVGGNGNFVEDTVMLTAAGLELSLDVKGRVSIGDRVKEIETQRIEAFKKNSLANGKLTPAEIAGIKSMETMQEELKTADDDVENKTGVNVKSALVYLNPHERDGVEGLEIIMVPGDPNQDPVHKFVEISHSELKGIISKIKREVTNARNPGRYIPPAQALYDLTIDKIYDNLQTLHINHLQIVPDQIFQKIPFSVLVDKNNNNQHLIEQFSLAVSPSFDMTQLQHHDLTNARRFVLAETFDDTNAPLPNALPEFNLVNGSNENEIPEDNKFTGLNLADCLISPELRTSPDPTILHVATHADYKPGVDNRQYIQAYDSSNNVTLAQILTYDFSPVDLVVFSACRTAIGEENREYGFSGVAWERGAKSVIGSLWYVSDGGTSAMMQSFYTQLSEQGLPIAKMLQEAQSAMIEGRVWLEGGEAVYVSEIPSEFDTDNRKYYQHPYYWSPFQIIGSGH